MDFSDKINQFITLIPSIKEKCKTEEATKNALVMPLLNILGYDVFNPTEVVPEFIADVADKKGEKVDYAIIQNNQPILLIECKHYSENLDVKHHAQLFWYFHATKAKFAILTNGLKYQFFSDLNEINKMDTQPFFEIDLLNIKTNQIEELKKFHKENFDPTLISSTAYQLKYITSFKNILHRELANPSEEFTKFFVREIYPNRRATNYVIDELKDVIKTGGVQYINEFVSQKLKTVLKSEEQKLNPDIPEETAKQSKINTTDSEIEAFYIIKSILRELVDSKRIAYKDTESYFSIMLDSKVTKWFCRLRFYEIQKFISIADKDKNEVRYELKTLDDIFKYKDQLIESVKNYLQ